MSGTFSLDGLKPSILAINAQATVQTEGRPLLPSDYAAWRAHARYGIHSQWPFVVQKGAGEPLHPFFLENLKENRAAREALTEDLRKDVMDAITASDLVGSNLSVLLTTTGRLIPGTPVTADNIAVDVYVTPRELRHHEAFFEEAVSVLTQIFIEKMAVPHCHELKRRGTRFGFMKEGAAARATPSLPVRQPWPIPPIPYTAAFPTTYQAVPGWPVSDIGDKVRSFLTSVFPAIGGAPSILPSLGPDEFDALAEDDSQWPNIDFEPSRSPSPISTSRLTSDTARSAAAMAQDMCRAAGRAQADVWSLENALAMKRAELESARTRAMQLGLRADEALTDHLVYHAFEADDVEARLEETRQARAALMSGNAPQGPTAPVPAPPSRTARAHTVPPSGTTKRRLETPPSTPRMTRVAKPSPRTPAVPSAVLRTLMASPSSSQGSARDAPSEDEAVTVTKYRSEAGWVHAVVAAHHLDESVAEALYGVMQCYPVAEWAQVIEDRFELEMAGALLEAMQKDFQAPVLHALDSALSPGHKGKGEGPERG